MKDFGEPTGVVIYYSADEEFEELCFDFGLELDEVVRDLLRGDHVFLTFHVVCVYRNSLASGNLNLSANLVYNTL